MNKHKEIALHAINKMHRECPWVRELFNAAGVELERISELLDEVEGNQFFDLAKEKMIARYEEDLGLNTQGTLAGRRSTVEAKWKAGGIVTLQMLENVLKLYRNGVIKLSFENGKIHVKFSSPIGRPPDIENILEMLDTIKPAHLPLMYTFLFINWGYWNGKKWGDLKTKHWLDAIQENE